MGVIENSGLYIHGLHDTVFCCGITAGVFAADLRRLYGFRLVLLGGSGGGGGRFVAMLIVWYKPIVFPTMSTWIILALGCGSGSVATTSISVSFWFCGCEPSIEKLRLNSASFCFFHHKFVVGMFVSFRIGCCISWVGCLFTRFCLGLLCLGFCGFCGFCGVALPSTTFLLRLDPFFGRPLALPDPIFHGFMWLKFPELFIILFALCFELHHFGQHNEFMTHNFFLLKSQKKNPIYTKNNQSILMKSQQISLFLLLIYCLRWIRTKHKSRLLMIQLVRWK